MADNDIIKVVPPEQPVFDPESKITWDEIAPSLQARFISLSDSINKNSSHINDVLGNTRITIGSEPPSDPEMERDVWIDTNKGIVRFYMSRTLDANNCKWEYTHAAWYGGSVNDVIIPTDLPLSDKWISCRSLIWISNEAKNNTYDPNNGLNMPKDICFTVPIPGYYKIVDNSVLFEYNAQKVNSDGTLKDGGYIHDGGTMNVQLFTLKHSIIRKSITDAISVANTSLNTLLTTESDKKILAQIVARINDLDYWNMTRYKEQLIQYINDHSMSNKEQVLAAVNTLLTAIETNVNGNTDRSQQVQIYEKLYDSKGVFEAVNNDQYPTIITPQLEAQDRIYLTVSNRANGRDPKSTNETSIYQVADFKIYRLNYGDPNT